jgi:hypothetical protein
MTCHLFLDNFLRFYDLWVVFKGLGVLKRVFVSRKLKYLNFDIMRCSPFSEFSSFAKDVILQKFWLCFRACDSRIVTYDPEFCRVVWFSCFNHHYGIFSLKSFLWNDITMVPLNVLGSKSWCCRKHVFVFEIVSLTDLNKFFLIELSFSLSCLGKKICSSLWKKVWKLFHFENWLWVKPFEKVLMCSLFLDTS